MIFMMFALPILILMALVAALIAFFMAFIEGMDSYIWSLQDFFGDKTRKLRAKKKTGLK
jgi:hypothetical protein